MAIGTDDGDMERLLPVLRPDRCGDGQLVVAIATPGQAPDPRFLAMIDAAPAIGYIDPLIDGS
jgi:hypothetical protein